MSTSEIDPATFRHVKYRWKDQDVAGLSPLERLVYRSNILGSDQSITNTGGGNTSSKSLEPSPLGGEPRDVLWVKGSGGDLRTAKGGNFASLDMSRLLSLREVYGARPDKGPKSVAEDDMVGLFPHCTYNLNPRASSIDTPLHGFLPARHVDHMHPSSVIAVAATRRSRELTEEVFGGDLGWVPWLRPGFELGLQMQNEAAANPALRGLIMSQHGLINWADDDKECYDLTLSLIERAAVFIEKHDKGAKTFGGQRHAALPTESRDSLLAELLPWMRGQLSTQRKWIGTVQSDEKTLEFVNSADAARLAELGTSCPDHFLRTKIKPLFLDWDPQSWDPQSSDPQSGDTAGLRQLLIDGLEAYRRDYAAYYDACKRPDSPPMRDPSPTVILIPGVGMITWGKNKSESRVTAEFYRCAIEVMRGAEAIDEYIALPQQEAFDIEYWRLEEAKLRRMPAENELAQQIIVVIGAGGGIGRCAAERFSAEGAHVVCADINAEAAQATADQLTEARGAGIGVAGTGVSDCGPAIGLGVDVRDRASVDQLLAQTALAYGGVDHIVMTAGVFLTDDQWEKTYAVNVMGPATVAAASRGVFREQNLEGSIVLTTSVNGVVSKKGSLAYDTSKAAANHLVRELAVEFAPLVRVNAVAPATVVQGSTMFGRERVLASLTKYEIPFSEDASDVELRQCLADFYAQRTLLKVDVTPEDQAEALFFLVSARSRKTTGQVINVDGGLHEAFLR